MEPVCSERATCPEQPEKIRASESRSYETEEYRVLRACMRLFVCVRVGLFILWGIVKGAFPLVFISPLDLNF